MAASSSTPPEDYGQSPLDIESEVPGVIVEIEAKDGQTVRIPKSELEFAENLKDQLECESKYFHWIETFLTQTFTDPPDSDSVIYIKLKNIDADVLWKMSDYLAFLKKVHTTEMSYEECVEFEGLFLSLDSEKPLIFAMLKVSYCPLEFRLLRARY